MQVKDRKLFPFKNFLGLDTENKNLKVSTFRASAGHNFIIDSGTLKTRHAVTYKKEFPFNMVSGETFIDLYNFRGAMVYITSKNIYVEYNGVVYDKSTLKTVINYIDFTGLKPIFIEEKDCLFIYGLKAVFVFAGITDLTGVFTDFILYDLKLKPSADTFFAFDEPKYAIYNDFPTAYEPILYIGDKAFEDVNLLSNATRYRLFGNVNKVQNKGYNKFNLVTHYDKNKHGEFETVDVKVEFFKGKYADLNALPYFMGILLENFDAIAPFGTVLNDSTPIEITDTFYSPNTFKYKKNGSTITPVSEIIGLDKQTFYSFKINDTENIYESILKYIKANVIANDCVLKFKLSVEYNAVYRDETTDYIVQETKNRVEKYVYVQLKLIDETAKKFVKESFLKSVVVQSPTAYPSYPTATGIFDLELNLSSSPVFVNGLDDTTIESLILDKMNEHKSTLTAGDRVKVNGQIYNPKTVTYVTEVIIQDQSEWLKKQSETIYVDEVPNYIEYPELNTTLPILTYGSLIIIKGTSFILSSTQLENIRSFIIKNFSLLPNQNGTAYIKVKLATMNIIGGHTYYFAMNVIISFTYVKPGTVSYDERLSFTYVANVENGSDLYKVEFNPLYNVFEFKILDLFYDFNLEPALEIRFAFEKNPDYEKISNTTIGTTFGSENRLFLSGDKHFPNVDRFNISNDLLGDNVKNQSYELTYFPSKNYRVLGGKGAINGYVVATDSQLYVTKEEYHNDDKLFVRQRNVDENGRVYYNEYKTSGKQSPLNSRCVVRFNNDILMLTKDGLYAVELSSNVLTDERLLKLRSGYINKTLKSFIAQTNNNNIYMVENDNYLYIVVGKNVFVADSRYISKNENSEVQNLSYEIVNWEFDLQFGLFKFINNEAILVEENGNIIYEMTETNRDHFANKVNSVIGLHTFANGSNAFILPSAYDTFLSDNKYIHTFKVANALKVLAKGAQYAVSGDTISINDIVAFRNINVGDKIYFKDAYGVFHENKIVSISDDFSQFVLENVVSVDDSIMYIDVENRFLFLTHIYNLTSVGKVFRLSPYEPLAVVELNKSETETEMEYLARIYETQVDNDDYIFRNNVLQNCTFNNQKAIELFWASAITDFGYNLFEKTMFRFNIYATKQDKENNIQVGYKTMRRLKSLDNGEVIAINKKVDLSNTFAFDSVDFNTFSLNTFNEFGSSFPAKENNFLYIQFVFLAKGQIELNSFEIIYKLNRQIKSIG